MKVIDLSMSLYTGMEVFQGDPEVEIELVQAQEKVGWEVRHISMGSHTGTHVDAYSHMHKNKETLDEIPLGSFFGKAQVVALSDVWPKGIGLFFIEEASLDVLEKIVGAGPGFVGGNLTEGLERALLGQGIITYTGLINLSLLPRGKTFMFYGLPLRIKSGDGSPVRAIAIIDG